MENVKNLVVYDKLVQLADELKLVELKKDDKKQEKEMFDKINKLNNEGIIKRRVEETGIGELFKENTSEFIKYITSEKLCFLNRMKAFESEYIKIFNDKRFNLILSLYFKNIDAYNHLTNFYSVSANHYNLSITEKDLEKIEHEFRLVYADDYEVKKGKITFNTKKSVINPEKYENYFNNPTAFIYPDRDYVSVDGEDMLYTKIKKKYDENKEKYKNREVIWVGKEHVDGLGCDILIVDTETNKEELHEVKTGFRDVTEGESDYIPPLDITKNEFRVAKETSKKPNCNYIYHKYIYDVEDINGPDLYSYEKITLYMNKKIGLFVDARDIIDKKDIKDMTIYVTVDKKDYLCLYKLEDYLKEQNTLKLYDKEELEKIKKIGRL